MKMKKDIFTAMILLGVLVLGSFDVEAQGEGRLAMARGTVNAQEIGGQGLYVFSFWNGNKKAVVGLGGSFSVLIMTSDRPQKLFVKDEKGATRALAMVTAGNSNDIVFDAASTAAAILFGDPALSRTSQDFEKLCQANSARASFQNLAAFLKERLPRQSLESLFPDEAYLKLFDECQKEIFGKGQEAIQESLSEAQGQFEKIMK